MISNHKVIREQDQDILYIYLDASSEFGLDFFKKDNLSKINNSIKDYIKEKQLAAKATVVVLMLNGIVISKLPMNEIYGSVDNKTEILKVVGNENIITHTVKKGDTLYSISRKFNVSINKLKELNNLKSDTLSIGQVLKVSDIFVIQYNVQKGDTLYSIATKYGTTVNNLKTLNNLTSDILSINQKLYIEAKAEEEEQQQVTDTYIVQQGDTLYSIALKFNTTVDDLKRINNLHGNTLSIGQVLIITGETTQESITSTYIVQKGDTLYAIAKRFNITVDEIKSLNNLQSNVLSIGQELKIPGTVIDESNQNKIYITLQRSNGKVEKIELETYIINVVAAEMPALFEADALKAQALASRTYTMKRVSEGKIMTDTTQTQSYKDIDALKKQWGKDFDKYYNKIKEAVYSTEGEVITYKGDYIDAIYHSTSNSRTEDPKYVWGGSLEYLKSVESSWDVNATGYKNTVTKDFATLTKSLGFIINKNTNVKVISKTSNGSVDVIKIGNKDFKGTQLRQLLGLRSTDFDIQIVSNGIKFTTRGYGHQVGMSQYGANGMAKEGYTHKEIINHYYTNVAIETINVK